MVLIISGEVGRAFIVHICRIYYKIFEDKAFKIIFKCQQNDKKEIMLQTEYQSLLLTKNYILSHFLCGIFENTVGFIFSNNSSLHYEPIFLKVILLIQNLRSILTTYGNDISTARLFCAVWNGEIFTVTRSNVFWALSAGHWFVHSLIHSSLSTCMIRHWSRKGDRYNDE